MRTTVTLLFLCSALVLSSCRPRSQRTSRQRQQTTQAAQPTGTKSAQQVMQRTDSVLANLSTLSDDVTDIPPRATMEDVPRMPWGAPMMAPPRPDLSGYGVYESALANFNGSRYNEAIGLFTQIAVSGRPPELVPNAYYWIGESYYAMQRYAEALQYFEFVTQAGPAYRREAAFYKLSRANHELGNDQAATTWYERLRAEYPRSAYVKTLRKLGVR